MRIRVTCEESRAIRAHLRWDRERGVAAYMSQRVLWCLSAAMPLSPVDWWRRRLDRSQYLETVIQRTMDRVNWHVRETMV